MRGSLRPRDKRGHKARGGVGGSTYPPPAPRGAGVDRCRRLHDSIAGSVRLWRNPTMVAETPSADCVVYPFRYRDARTKKWVLARYMATKVEIAARYEAWEIVGASELREPMGESYFTPWAAQLVAPTVRPLGQRFLELGPHRRKPPAIDARERQLVGVFLRRLIVYEARKGRFDQVRNAADLLVEVAGAAG